jgi:protein-arginine kinase
MLLSNHLSPALQDLLQPLQTSTGFTFDALIRSGTENPDSSIGLYAGDAETYEVFAPLLEPVVQDYHQKETLESFHHWELDSPLSLPPEAASRVRSTRVRVARNLADLPFPAGSSLEQRLEVERRVREALAHLPPELQGTYYSLPEMSEEERQRWIEAHLLFKEGDRFLKSAGILDDWPQARGFFVSHDQRFVVWINEEDHLRIISIQEGWALQEVFERLHLGLTSLQQHLEFAFSPKFGYLNSCPSNLGTAMRASVHAHLPQLTQQEGFRESCKEMGLSVRGIHGEHSEGAGGVFDLSKRQRLGASESALLTTLYQGLQHLFAKENTPL